MRLKIYILSLLVFTLSCKDEFEKNYKWHSIKVTATAYNSLAYQTNSNPNVTAFGDSLKPGMKYIAVSKDLINKGLKYNTPIKIIGLEGFIL